MNYEFAKCVVGADIKAHGQVVLESKDPEYNYYFAEKVKGSDILAHRNVVIESYHIFWICQLDDYMDEEDVRCFNEINNKILSLSPSDK